MPQGAYPEASQQPAHAYAEEPRPGTDAYAVQAGAYATAPPQAGPYAGAVPPRPSSPSLLAAKEPWLAALIHVGLALAGAVASSALVVLLGVIGFGTLDDQDVASAVSSQWFPLIVQFLGAGFFGAFDTTVAAMGVTVTASLFFVPLLVPVGAGLAVLLFGRRAAQPLSLPPLWRALTAGIAGAIFAAVVLILQLAAPISIAVPEAPSVDIRAVSAISVMFGILIIAGAVFVSLSPRGATRGRWRSGALQAVEHLGGVGALIGLGLFTAALVNVDGGAGALVLFAPLLLPMLAAEGTGIGAFSAVSTTVQGDVENYLPVDLPAYSFTTFSDALPLWARVVIPVVAVLALLFAALRWRVRRGAVNDVAGWFVLPVGYAALGILVMVAGRISVTAAFGGDSGILGAFLGEESMGMAAAIAPAPWTFVLFAVFGAAVEALSRFVVPAAARTLPSGLLRALAFGAAAAPAAAAVQPAPTVRPQPADYAAVGSAAGGAEQSPDAAVAERLDPLAASAPYPPAQTAAYPTAGAAAYDSAQSQSQSQSQSQPAPPADDPFQKLLAGEERQPVSRKAKTAWIVAGGSALVIVLLVAGGLIAHGYLSGTKYSPQAKAEKYLEAIVDGDADEALELWAPNVESADRVLLRDDIYAAAENRPTEYEVGDVAEIERTDTVEVAATLTVDTKKYDVSFTLEKAGSADVVFDDWRIVAGPEQTIAVGDVTKVTAVNGVEVDLSQVSGAAGAGEDGFSEGQFRTLPVLPGDYVFAAPKADGVFSYGEDQTVTALPGANDLIEGVNPEDLGLISFTADWTDEAQNQAIAQVQQRIDECMKSDQFVPKLCQNNLTMSEPFFMAVTDIKRSWDTEPSLRFETREDGDYVVVDGGELRFDYKERYSEDDEWEADDTVDSAPFGWTGASVPVAATEDGDVEADFSDF
ncbi:zinc ribbon domain-containing protein [Microbacterium halophytorum]|uniref:hypothetical protein n=1 Tax=Microbacterium halophytorum TaxID=2067568 RepID=UPI00131A26A1|nr:hypothetical protein [Microbacterium halophytorum]